MIEGGLGEHARCGAQLLRVARREVLGEHGDVLGALAQRRDLDRHHVQAVEQVLAEAALAHVRSRSRCVAATMRTSTFSARLPPTRGDLVALQHAQQLGLQLERHVADLVEEERAARRLAEASRAALDGAREGALLVAEELALEQLARDRRAFTATKAPAARGDAWWIARATSSLPVPLSPVISTATSRARDAPDRLEDLEHRAAAADEAIAAPLARPRTSRRSERTSRSSARVRSAFSTSASTSATWNGFTR